MPKQPRKPSSTARGLGPAHRARREMLLRNHVDGTICPLCPNPMFRDPLLNFDGQVLHADHSNARALYGNHQLADRLAHGQCDAREGGRLRARLAGERLRDDGEQIEPVDLGRRLLDWPF